jgi:hypothetical protein
MLVIILLLVILGLQVSESYGWYVNAVNMRNAWARQWKELNERLDVIENAVRDLRD